MDFGPKSWIFGIWDFCPGILVPGFGVPEVRGPDFKSLSSRHAASGGSKFSKMTPPEFQRSFRLHFWQLSGHKTPNHHTLKMKSAFPQIFGLWPVVSVSRGVFFFRLLVDSWIS